MKDTLDLLRGFQSRLLLAIHGIADEDLRRPEGEGRWSIAQVIAHLGHLELVAAVRFRSMLAHDAPTLVGFEQNEWMAGVSRGESTAELLESFWFDRRRNAGLLEKLTDAELSRTGVHASYGLVTIAEYAAKVAAHQENHLRQIERIKTTLGLAASDEPDVSGVVAGSPSSDHSPGDGVRVRTLWQNGVKRALEVEIDAGKQWPGIDYHVPGPEEVYVLAGDIDDGASVYRAGTFLHHPAGSSHSPRSTDGCRLFVFYPEG